jgi:signal transduction histidine kinase
VAHDVTHQQQLETDLRDAVDDLRRANTLKDHFIATASHELRTPLTSIAGFSSTVLERWSTLGEDDRVRFVGIIDAQAQRLVRLVDELLDMARIDAGSINPRQQDVELLPLLEELIVLLDGSDAALTCAPGLVVTADPDYLAQVLTNLIANALRYGRPPIRIDATSADGRARIEVVDHGDGVADDFRPYLFDKFTQARRDPAQPVEGTGLGLSIARGLVRAMGGELTHEPVEPNGARFVVDLPLATTRRASSRA